jgi:hypothetical protein
MASTNSLRPLAEHAGKFSPSDANIWSHRVVDRALIECRELMEEALEGLETIPPVAVDLTTIEAGKKRLVAIAAQLKIPQNLVDAEIAKLNDPYVAAKTEARKAHPEAGETGKELTRAITNLYAVSHAYAALIKEAIVPHLPKKAVKKPAPYDGDTADVEIDLMPKRTAPIDEGETGNLTEAAGLPLPDDNEFDMNNGEPLKLDDDLMGWLDEPETKPAAKPIPPKTVTPKQAAKPVTPPAKSAAKK